MEIIRLHDLKCDQQKFWLEKIREENRHFPVLGRMVDQIEDGSFLKRSKGFYEPYLMIDEDRLIALSILASQDDIICDLGPWIGYVYTNPDYRGHQYAFRLIETIENDLKKQGIERVYISSGHRGLYEKAGYQKLGWSRSHSGRPTKIFEKKLV